MPEVPTGTPHWVNVFGIVFAIMVLAVVVILLTRTGGHGPGRHMGQPTTISQSS